MNILTIEANLPAIRATLLDERATVLGSASRQLPVAVPSFGAREVNAEDIRAGLIEVVREATESAPSSPELIAITGSLGGLWLSDSVGDLIRPAILGDDGRAGAVLDGWIEAGIAAAAFRRSGSAADTGSLVSLIRYLEDEEPMSLEQSVQAGNAVSGLGMMLTQTAGASLAAAPHHLIDPHHARYDEELVDLYRLRPWRNLLPQIEDQPLPFNPGPALDELRPLIHPEALVHAGTIDITAMLAGSGIDRPGGELVHLGRSLDCLVLTNRFDTEMEPAGITLGPRHQQYWIRAFSGASGMAALDWFLGITGHSYQELNALIAAAQPGAGGAMAIPVISSTGERAPFVDRQVRGRLIGLSSATSDAELARAMAEGIAFATRHALESAGSRGIDPVAFCGSGVRAPAFRQLLADVLGRPVIVGPHPEPAAPGAATEAMRAIGRQVEMGESADMVEEVVPNNALRGLYDHAFARYLRELVHVREDRG